MRPLQTELAHPDLKSRYRRTNKRGFIKQIGDIERIQSRTRAIRALYDDNRQLKAKALGIDEESLPSADQSKHHIISESCADSFGLSDWISTMCASGAPSVSMMCLQRKWLTWGGVRT